MQQSTTRRSQLAVSSLILTDLGAFSSERSWIKRRPESDMAARELQSVPKTGDKTLASTCKRLAHKEENFCVTCWNVASRLVETWRTSWEPSAACKGRM